MFLGAQMHFCSQSWAVGMHLPFVVIFTLARSVSRAGNASEQITLWTANGNLSPLLWYGSNIILLRALEFFREFQCLRMDLCITNLALLTRVRSS